jgi:DNA repair exonuclease SbcCD ATPase subunit
MKAPHQKAIRIQKKTDAPLLSNVQKQFNTLLKKIETQKKLLQQWQETIPAYHSRLNGEYESLWDEYNQRRAELVKLLDGAYHEKLFHKTDRNKLKHLIETISTELILEYGMEELKEVYNKYNDTDFDTENQAIDADVSEMMKQVFKEMTGIEIGDDEDVSSPEKLQAVLQAKVLEQKELHEEKQRVLEEKRSKRKKTAKQLEKEAQLKEEEQNVSKSIQEVYRKLVSSLHPDREPDEEERERKTKIMQEVNVAYNKKDLLRLLELQLELEQIDEAHLNNIAEDRLKYFNKILKEQLRELQQEVSAIEHGFKMQSNWSPFFKLSPEQLMAKLECDIKDVGNDVVRLKADLEAFQELKNLKSFLKTYKISKQSQELSLDDFLFS